MKAGLYGPADHRRQLWWCYPAGHRTDPAKHRFSEDLPRTVVADAEGGSFCPECTTHREAHQGPVHLRTYEHSASVVAAALVSVGHGTTYQDAALTARVSSGWARKRGAGRGSKKLAGMPTKRGANGTLVADWVGLFGPVVTAPLRDGVSWPRVVALDDLPFTGSVRRRRAQAARGYKKDAATWGIIGAYEFRERRQNGSRQAGQLFALHATPALGEAQVTAFLTSIPGRPSFVICDGSTKLAKAIDDAWPDVVDPTTGEVLAATPTLLPCLWHLGRTLERTLRASSVLARRGSPEEPLPPFRTGPLPTRVERPRRLGRGASSVPEPHAKAPDPKHQLVTASRVALRSVGEWDTFVRLAHHYQAKPLTDWVGDGQGVHDLLANWPYDIPRGVGGLEAELAHVRGVLAARSAVLSNITRTNSLLDLIVMSRRGQASAQKYTLALHAALTPVRGKAQPQKVGVNGGPRLQNS